MCPFELGVSKVWEKFEEGRFKLLAHTFFASKAFTLSINVEIVFCCSWTTLVSTPTISIELSPFLSDVATSSGTSSAMNPMCSFSSLSARYLNLTGLRSSNANTSWIRLDPP